MDRTRAPDGSARPYTLLRFRKASQAVHATYELDQVLMRVIEELYSALDAEAASVALVDMNSGEITLYAAGPVAELVSGLQVPRGRGIIGWSIAGGESTIVNDVMMDPRFWPAVDSYSGFKTRSVMCAPMLAGNRVIGAVEVLNKQSGEFKPEDLLYLEAFGTVAASAIENARLFRKEQQQRRQGEALRRTWEVLTAPRTPQELLDVILDQLARLITYRSASILLVDEEGSLELSASRGLTDPARASRFIDRLGLEAKVLTMLETHQPLLISDTRSDSRWQHFPGLSYINSWIGAPLLIKGHLIGTLNVDHEKPGFYNDDDLPVVANFAQQAAIAIENSRLYAATRRVTLQLAEQARRMVTLHESSRTLLSGLDLDPDALQELVRRIADLIGARYGILNLLVPHGKEPWFIVANPDEAEIPAQDRDGVVNNLLDLLGPDREVLRSEDLHGTMGIPSFVRNSFLAIAVHARNRLMGHLLFADKGDAGQFSQDDESLALALAANLASAVENAGLYQKTQQQLRELNALYEVTRAVTGAKETGDVFAPLAAQVAQLLDVEHCAILVFAHGRIVCQPPGYGIPDAAIPLLDFPLTKGDPLYSVIHTPDPFVVNADARHQDEGVYGQLLEQILVRQLLGHPFVIDEERIGLIVAAGKRSGETFSRQDKHLISIIAHQISNVLERTSLQSRQQEQSQIQAALLKVSRAISSLTSLDALLQTVVHISRDLVGCDHCLIATWDEEKMAFIPRAQSGLEDRLQEALAATRLAPADLPPVNRATETREPALLIKEDIRTAIPETLQSVLGTENSLIVPLVAQNRVVGLITAAYMGQGRPPGEREIALATGIARQAAIAIENANLYRDLQLHAVRLERAYSALKEVDEQRAMFIQNVSHEMRTPLTLIKGHLELLLDGALGDLSGRQKERLHLIADKTEQLGQLIFDIMTIQSIDARSLDLQQFDLALLCQSFLADFELPSSSIRIVNDFPTDLPPAMADPGLVERTLQHLLDNAVKFSPGGGTIRLRAWPENGMIRVEVEDQGIGIPSDSVSYVFELFYQADGSTTRRFGGIGLGLTIAKRIVSAHGGEISVRSVEGEGTTVSFTLPTAPEPPVLPAVAG
jgi:GAF domain-containing protein/anti-sigma regulatory factor (Ser/Thr protein kinase)